MKLIWINAFALCAACASSPPWVPPPGPEQNTSESNGRAANVIVRIEAQWGDKAKSAPELGAGISVGYINDKLHVLTACHVVNREDGTADRIDVFFRAAPRVSHSAHVIACDKQRDVAALGIDVDVEEGIMGDIPKLALARVVLPLKKGLTAKTISHPGAKLWHVEEHAVVSATTDEISFERGSTQSGSSGGALLSTGNRLLGMITSIDVGEGVGYAVPSEGLVQLMNQWKIPYRKTLYADFEAPLEGIYKAVWDSNGNEFCGETIDDDRPHVNTVHRAKSSVFGGPAVAVNCSVFIELLDTYKSKAARLELKNTFLRAIGNVVARQDGTFRVEQDFGDNTIFSRFEFGRGTIHIELFDSGYEFYLMIYHNDGMEQIHGKTYQLPADVNDMIAKLKQQVQLSGQW